jgi:hypothetical protein
LGANNLIIDEMGFTGEVFAKNLIQNGDLGGWSYTLDELHIAVEINQFKLAGFTGTLDIPLAESKGGGEKNFTYQALIHPGNEYSFSVTTNDSLKFDIWAADVLLKPGSTVEVAVIKDKFMPSALLHGSMNIGAGKAKLLGIHFEGLKLQNMKPKISVTAVSFSSGKTGGFAKFPLTIGNIGIKSEDDRMGLSVDVKINLMGEEKQGFAGDASLVIWGKEDNSDGKSRWEIRKSTSRSDWCRYYNKGL